MEDIYQRICEMRRLMVAPFDYAGCHTHTKRRDDFWNYTILISLIISSRSKDQQVQLAMKNLNDKYELSPKKISEASDGEIKTAINVGISFVDKKVKDVKETSRIIQAMGIPKTEKEISDLPGIGPKSKDLYLAMISVDGNVKNVAIDTHLERIFKRWCWVDEKDSIPKITSKISAMVPPELKKDMFQIVSGFGQMICSSTPRCEMCTASEICPYSKRKTIDIEDFSKIVKNETVPDNAEWITPKGQIKTLWK